MSAIPESLRWLFWEADFDAVRAGSEAPAAVASPLDGHPLRLYSFGYG